MSVIKRSIHNLQLILCYYLPCHRIHLHLLLVLKNTIPAELQLVAPTSHFTALIPYSIWVCNHKTPHGSLQDSFALAIDRKGKRKQNRFQINRFSELNDMNCRFSPERVTGIIRWRNWYDTANWLLNRVSHSKEKDCLHFGETSWNLFSPGYSAWCIVNKHFAMNLPLI